MSQLVPYIAKKNGIKNSIIILYPDINLKFRLQLNENIHAFVLLDLGKTEVAIAEYNHSKKFMFYTFE